MTGYADALRNFQELRGDFNGGFRASIPTLAKAQLKLTMAQSEAARLPRPELNRAQQNLLDWVNST